MLDYILKFNLLGSIFIKITFPHFAYNKYTSRPSPGTVQVLKYHFKTFTIAKCRLYMKYFSLRKKINKNVCQNWVQSARLRN